MRKSAAWRISAVETRKTRLYREQTASDVDMRLEPDLILNEEGQALTPRVILHLLI
jgi:hypothetical protein